MGQAGGPHAAVLHVLQAAAPFCCWLFAFAGRVSTASLWAHTSPTHACTTPSHCWAIGGGGGGVWVGRWQPVQVHHYHDAGAQVLP